jgi:serine/threonine protein kinase
MPASEPEQKDILYRSERTVVFRMRVPGGPSAIYKQPVGANAVKRMRHELGILERLGGVAGVPRLVSGTGSKSAIVLEDAGDFSLADIARTGPMEIAPFLQLALDIARIVAAVHRTGVLHKDINPSNILLAGPQLTPVLIDFDLATTFAEQRPRFAHDRQIAGTLAYIAPEQTGRTGRSVDQRADLYALGVTFYEIVTGRLPFDSRDPLQLLHDHLARIPAAPSEVDPRVPRGLSDIVMRLLQKEPDRRYQSADGLAYDLSALRAAIALGETSLPRLGERDFPLQLASPSRLAGRDAEIEALRTAFDSSLRGERRGLLVTGPAGVGKTALINELRTIVTANRGWYVSGKFEQHRRDAGFGAVLQALRGLGHLLLAEPEAKLAAQRADILNALGPKAGLLTALLPEFAVLLGEVPEVAPT